eukprot:TCALIF_09693-PC protein Name:"Similar to FAM43A Protein FAM43A (Homo sapiens)" AED:0.27 eAED:0.27 QI:0/0.66/0.75/1/0.66/0.75/4/197/673
MIAVQLNPTMTSMGLPHVRISSTMMKPKFWKKKRSATISDIDPEYRVIYLGNVLTAWARGDGCVDKPLSTLWRNHVSSDKANIVMKLTITAQGLKAVTKEHGLTEYWAHRITFCAIDPSYPKVFCWIYRHEGRKMKQELRCHAVLCSSNKKAHALTQRLQERLHQALVDFKKEKISRQNARLSLANTIYDNPSMPYRKILLHTGSSNYRPSIDKGKAAPKLKVIEEAAHEVDETDPMEFSSSKCDSLVFQRLSNSSKAGDTILPESSEPSTAMTSLNSSLSNFPIETIMDNPNPEIQLQPGLLSPDTPHIQSDHDNIEDDRCLTSSDNEDEVDDSFDKSDHRNDDEDEDDEDEEDNTLEDEPNAQETGGKRPREDHDTEDDEEHKGTNKHPKNIPDHHHISMDTYERDKINNEQRHAQDRHDGRDQDRAIKFEDGLLPSEFTAAWLLPRDVDADSAASFSPDNHQFSSRLISNRRYRFDTTDSVDETHPAKDTESLQDCCAIDLKALKLHAEPDNISDESGYSEESSPSTCSKQASGKIDPLRRSSESDSLPHRQNQTTMIKYLQSQRYSGAKTYVTLNQELPTETDCDTLEVSPRRSASDFDLPSQRIATTPAVPCDLTVHSALMSEFTPSEKLRYLGKTSRAPQLSLHNHGLRNMEENDSASTNDTFCINI